MAKALRDRPVRLARAELSLLFEDALRGLEPPRDMQAGRGGEMVQRVIANGPRALDGAAPPPGPAEVRDVPPDRREQLVRLLEPTTERQEQQPHDRQQRADRDHPQQRHPAVVLQDAGERDAILLGSLTVHGRLIGVRMCRPVLHPGARRHEHLPAGQARTPREVDRIAVRVGRRTDRALATPLWRRASRSRRPRGPRARDRTGPDRSPRVAAATSRARNGRPTARRRAGCAGVSRSTTFAPTIPTRSAPCSWSPRRGSRRSRRRAPCRRARAGRGRPPRPPAGTARRRTTPRSRARSSLRITRSGPRARTKSSWRLLGRVVDREDAEVGYVCAASAWRHSRRAGSAARTTRMPRTDGSCAGASWRSEEVGRCAHARRGARAAASLARGAAAQAEGGPEGPPSTSMRTAISASSRNGASPACAWLPSSWLPACAWPPSSSSRRLALGCRLLGCRLALGRLPPLRLAGLRLAADFLAAGLRLAAFRLFAAGLRLAADFLAAGLRFAADFRFAGLRLAADFLAAGLLGCRLPLRRLALGCRLPLGCCHAAPFPFRSSRALGIGPYDAMRFRRRRSRSLMPPHTPYRSSRRSA